MKYFYIEKDVFCAQRSRIFVCKECFRFLVQRLHFCFQLWRNSENIKQIKHINKDKIKKQLIESITINNVVEMEDLNQLAEKVQKLEEAADIIKKYEEILRTERKGIVSMVYYQGKIFKRFKEKEKFIQMLSKLKIHKSTTIFKINIFKHPGLMKSSVTLTFLKNYLQYIKKICKGNSSEFE